MEGEYRKSEYSSRILRASGFILELFLDLQYSTQVPQTGMQSESTFSSRLYTDPHSGWKKSIHFACQLEALGSGISQIQKQFQNPEANWNAK
jgi:hypothetical protein